jgi:exodeoxyribonuclease V alpha subunit
LRAALDVLDDIGATYLLAAPTGKAAKRMSEATGRKAFTLHTLLKIRPSNGWFYGGGVSQGPSVETDFIFVDEASMIDTMLMAELIGRLGSARLRLIGDANQLPPVGPGQPFNDFIKSGHVPVSRLTKLHRAAADSWIAVNAKRILEGEMPDLERRSDFRFIECRNAAAIGDVLKHIFENDDTEWIHHRTCAALSPQHKGPAGVTALNKLLHDTLNLFNAESPEQLEISEHEVIRLGSTVMITRNDPKRGLVNGDIGSVVYIEADDKGVVLELQVGDVVGDEDPSRRYRYTGKQAAVDLTLAYCFTVHKAQGSEYEWVIIVCHPSHRMTTRRLFYTAVTRAKLGVILVGTRDGVQHAIANTADKQRLTRLVERMNAKQLELASEAAHGRLH